MTAPISATTATPAPDYPVSFHYSNRGYLQSNGLAISAKLPDAYVAHLARAQARDLDRKGIKVNQADLNLDAADISDGHTVNRLLQDYDLVATTTMTITEINSYHFMSRWRSYVSLVGTATTSFTDDDGQTHTMSTLCDIALHHTMFVGTADHSGHGQSLGLSPEQVQEMEGLNHPYSVVDYLNAQYEQAPLITDLEWKIAQVV